MPKNQWGIDVTDPSFAKLYQLDQAVNNDAEKATAPADDKADAEVVLLGQPDTDGTRVKYKLGPTLLTGRAIETASAGLANGKWVVNPVYKDGKDGIDLFNKAAALCNAGAPECPGIASGEGGAQVGQQFEGRAIARAVAHHHQHAAGVAGGTHIHVGGIGGAKLLGGLQAKTGKAVEGVLHGGLGQAHYRLAAGELVAAADQAVD